MNQEEREKLLFHAQQMRDAAATYWGTADKAYAVEVEDLNPSIHHLIGLSIASSLIRLGDLLEPLVAAAGAPRGDVAVHNHIYGDAGAGQSWHAAQSAGEDIQVQGDPSIQEVGFEGYSRTGGGWPERMSDKDVRDLQEKVRGMAPGPDPEDDDPDLTEPPLDVPDEDDE